jgi:hypothetical protein
MDIGAFVHGDAAQRHARVARLGIDADDAGVPVDRSVDVDGGRAGRSRFRCAADSQAHGKNEPKLGRPAHPSTLPRKAGQPRSRVDRMAQEQSDIAANVSELWRIY